MENPGRNPEMEGGGDGERDTVEARKGVTFSPTAHLYELILLSMYYSLDGH